MKKRELDANRKLQITRRSLLGTALAGGALAAAGSLAPVAGSVESTLRSEVASFDLAEMTIADLQKAMETGTFTSRALVEKYLARIAMLDQKGPKLQQILELNPDALAIADKLDAERKQKGPRGPLHGIPILLKDNIDTADRMTTTAGSLALEGSVAKRDAFIVERLRVAGAVLLGKTNMSEWANFRSTHGSSGWSGRGGQGKNPYVLDRNTSGSSSGSAAAVAANFCAAAIGTETDGSIVSPASVNSIVGIKPTVGLVSRTGIIPIAHNQDTAGPMTRTVADAAILLGVMAGSDPRDVATSKAKSKAHLDYTKFLDRDGLRGARLGILRKGVGLRDMTETLLDEVIGVLERQGAVVVDPADIETLGQFDESEYEVLLYEFKEGLNRYLAGLGPDAHVHSLKELIAFNEKHRDREMPWFGQEIFVKAEAKGNLESKEYREALKKNHELSRAKGIDAVMAKHKLDALVAITNGPAWLIDLVNGDHYTGGSSTPAAVSGYPTITVPAGFVKGLPVGLSFLAGAWEEGNLIRLAYAFEQATRARRTPEFLRTLGESRDPIEP